MKTIYLFLKVLIFGFSIDLRAQNVNCSNASEFPLLENFCLTADFSATSLFDTTIGQFTDGACKNTNSLIYLLDTRFFFIKNSIK